MSVSPWERSTAIYVASLLEIGIATAILTTAWTEKHYMVVVIPIALALAGSGAAVAGRRGAVLSVSVVSVLLLIWRYVYTQDMQFRDVLGVLLFSATALVLAGLAMSRSRLQSELRAREEETGRAWRREAELVRAKDDFLNMVAHELRNPASVIVGCVDLLVRHVVPESQHQQVIADLSRESRRLKDLIEDLLAIARVDAGVRPAFEPILLPRLIAQCVNEFHERYDNEVRLDLEPDLPMVAGSELNIERVLTNILDNAAKYSPADLPIEIQAHRANGRVQVAVLDSGAGIPAGASNLIFERFFRVEPAGEGRGYGLGLAISRRLVEANNGRIWAGNREAGGLQVTFELGSYQEKEAEPC